MDPITIAMGLAQFVPGIVKLITGSNRAEDAAEAVINVAKVVTGKDTGEGALEAIKADPNKILDFQTAIAAQQSDLEKAYLSDRQDARHRDVAIVQAGRNNIRGDVLAYAAIGSLVLCIAALFFVERIPATNEKLLYLVIGSLIVIVKDVYGFEYGSSKGSERNAQAAADALKP